MSEKNPVVVLGSLLDALNEIKGRELPGGITEVWAQAHGGLAAVSHGPDDIGVTDIYNLFFEKEKVSLCRR